MKRREKQSIPIVMNLSRCKSMLKCFSFNKPSSGL